MDIVHPPYFLYSYNDCICFTIGHIISQLSHDLENIVISYCFLTIIDGRFLRENLGILYFTQMPSFCTLHLSFLWQVSMTHLTIWFFVLGQFSSNSNEIFSTLFWRFQWFSCTWTYISSLFYHQYSYLAYPQFEISIPQVSFHS